MEYKYWNENSFARYVFAGASFLASLFSVNLSRAADTTVTPPDQDIWTTSVYSFAPGGANPGGGLANENLVVGGWGDLYYSLLKFNLAGLPKSATKVELRLYDQSDNGGSQTSLSLYKITQAWNWQTQGTGSDQLRLWWADQPSTVPYSKAPLPAPTVGSAYYIDITKLYNSWQKGTIPNYGIELRPTLNNDNFDFFASSRNPNSEWQPTLIITTSRLPEYTYTISGNGFFTRWTDPLNIPAIDDSGTAILNGAIGNIGYGNLRDLSPGYPGLGGIGLAVGPSKTYEDFDYTGKLADGSAGPGTLFSTDTRSSSSPDRPADGTDANFVPGSYQLTGPGGDYTLTISPGVPEPSTWGMMFLGFAGLGFAARWKARDRHAVGEVAYRPPGVRGSAGATTSVS